MATYNELAKEYATNKRTEYENSLGYLTNDLQASNQATIDSINSQYNNLINSINNQKTDVISAYEDSARQAYINKMLAGRQLDTTLSQLGINTQGIGVQERLNNELAYGQNLATALRTREEGLGDIAERVTTAEGDRTTALNQQAATYAEALAEANRYKQSLVDNYYNREYSNFLEDLRYQDQLKQQAWENAMAEKQFQQSQYEFNASLNAKKGVDNFTWAVGTDPIYNNDGTVTWVNPSGETRTVGKHVNPYTINTNPDVANGFFEKTPYQPDNIGGHKLSKSPYTWTVDHNPQNVWTPDKGKTYYVWYGKENRYQQVEVKVGKGGTYTVTEKK